MDCESGQQPKSAKFLSRQNFYRCACLIGQIIFVRECPIATLVPAGLISTNGDTLDRVGASAAAPSLEVARGRAALLQIPLVIFPRAIKHPRRRNFRRDRPLELPARLQGGFRLLRDRFLLRRMKEYRRSILLAEVPPLPVHLCWVVHQPETLEQLLVADLLRVENHFHRFPMSLLAPPNPFFRPIRPMPISLPHPPLH